MGRRYGVHFGFGHSDTFEYFNNNKVVTVKKKVEN